MRILPTSTSGPASVDGAQDSGAVTRVGPSPQPVDLWLPPGLRTKPAEAEAPRRLWIPERFGRPRTEAEQNYYRALISESRAFIDGQRAGLRDSSSVVLKEQAQLQEQAPLREGASLKDEAPVYREADGFVVHGPGVEAPRAVRDERLIRAGLKAEVPHRKQIGGTCGLYALGMVMDHWHQRDPKQVTALVQPEDRTPVEDPRGFVHFHHEPTDPRYVMEVAKEAGFTAKGEMYQAEFVAETATHFGYEASLHTEATLDDLYRVLDAGHPAIVAFNVDMNGEAGTPDSGARAHYAVIEGYLDHEGERYVVAKHSWSKTEDHVWKASDFLASWSNLKTTKFYGTPGDGLIPKFPELAEPAQLNLPDAGGGRADISQALARTLVEVVPKGEALTGGRRYAAPAVGPQPA